MQASPHDLYRIVSTATMPTFVGFYLDPFRQPIYRKNLAAPENVANLNPLADSCAVFHSMPHS
mgnify:CR=1